jgi:hypothetical protein
VSQGFCSACWQASPSLALRLAFLRLRLLRGWGTRHYQLADSPDHAIRVVASPDRGALSDLWLKPVYLIRLCVLRACEPLGRTACVMQLVGRPVLELHCQIRHLIGW